MLYFIVYSSHSKKKFTIQELSDLWKKSVKNNISLGITGILIHLNERFIQLLEGEKTIVEELYGKIVKDERLNDVTQLLKGTLKNRNYEKWLRRKIFFSLNYSSILACKYLLVRKNFYKQPHYLKVKVCSGTTMRMILLKAERPPAKYQLENL